MLFNPAVSYRYPHILLALLISAGWFIGGSAAWYLVRQRALPFARPHPVHHPGSAGHPDARTAVRGRRHRCVHGCIAAGETGGLRGQREDRQQRLQPSCRARHGQGREQVPHRDTAPGRRNRQGPDQKAHVPGLLQPPLTLLEAEVSPTRPSPRTSGRPRRARTTTHFWPRWQPPPWSNCPSTPRRACWAVRSRRASDAASSSRARSCERPRSSCSTNRRPASTTVRREDLIPFTDLPPERVRPGELTKSPGSPTWWTPPNAHSVLRRGVRQPPRRRHDTHVQYGLPPHATTDPHTDYAAIATAAREYGIRVERPVELRGACARPSPMRGPAPDGPERRRRAHGPLASADLRNIPSP